MSEKLTDIIQKNYGVIKNPYQGDDKKVLFVCSAGILRSATAARIYAKKYNTRAAGTYGFALVKINKNLVAWADEIVFVNYENFSMFVKEYTKLYEEVKNKIKVLDVPDIYNHMHPELIKCFEEQYEKID